MNFNEIKDKINNAIEETIFYLKQQKLIDNVISINSEFDLHNLIHEICDKYFIYYNDQDVLAAYYNQNDRDRSPNENFSEAYLEFISEIEERVLEELKEFSLVKEEPVR